MGWGSEGAAAYLSGGGLFDPAQPYAWETYGGAIALAVAGVTAGQSHGEPPLQASATPVQALGLCTGTSLIPLFLPVGQTP
jgi:hypothetical protein